MARSVWNAAVNIALVVTTAGTALVAVLLLRPGVRTNPATAASARWTAVENWRDYTVAGHVIGSDTAAITFVVFSDFQCPYCKTLSDNLAALRVARTEQIRIVFRHFPLVNERSLAAAVASECAAAQGRFEQFHNVLFLNQTAPRAVSWEGYAAEAGVGDVTRFSSCLLDGAPRTRVQQDVLAGEQLGVTGTPTTLLHGVRFSGAPSIRVLDSLVSATGAARKDGITNVARGRSK